MSEQREITFDVGELKEAAETGRSIHIQRYVDGELMELEVQVYA